MEEKRSIKDLRAAILGFMKDEAKRPLSLREIIRAFNVSRAD